MDYEELKGEIEDVEFGNMSINDCVYYNEVLDELGDEFLNYVKDGMTITIKEDGIVEVDD